MPAFDMGHAQETDHVHADTRGPQRGRDKVGRQHAAVRSRQESCPEGLQHVESIQPVHGKPDVSGAYFFKNIPPADFPFWSCGLRESRLLDGEKTELSMTHNTTAPTAL